MTKKLLSTSIVFLIQLLTSGSVAFALDHHSPRTAALGGAGRAGPLLNDSIVMNPSFASFLPAYSFAANYLYSGGEPLTSHGYHISIQDGKTEMLQAGIALTKRSDASFIHLGLSKSFLEKFAGGTSGKLIRNNSNGIYTGEMVLSLTGLFANWIQLGIVIDNLIQTEAAKELGIYREIILGMKFNIKGIVLAYLDPFVTPSLTLDTGLLGYSGGLEFVIMRDFFLRVGHHYNSYVPFLGKRAHGMGLGFGWMGPKISLDYGFARIFQPTPAWSHTFGTTFFF